MDYFTEQSDQIAMGFVAKLILPPVISYIVFTLVIYEQVGWYSWFVSSAAAIVFTTGIYCGDVFIVFRLYTNDSTVVH